MDKFINDLINVVVQTPKNKFDAIKSTLKHNSMATVYCYFKNSHVMIKAVQANNKHALKWLISMNVSSYIQDENGMTILMYSVEKTNILTNDLSYYIKPFASDKKCINQEDYNGRTALFYAFNNISSLRNIIESGIDVNHKDHEENNILIYCCKYGKIRHIKFLLKQKIDINATDNEGRTAGIHLAMNGYYADSIIKGPLSLYYITLTENYSTFLNIKKAGHKMNFINKQGESILSLVLTNMYKTTNPKKI